MADQLLEEFEHKLDEVTLIPSTGGVFEVAVDDHFEYATRGGGEGQGFDLELELLEDPPNHAHGTVGIASGCAVFDRKLHATDPTRNHRHSRPRRCMYLGPTDGPRIASGRDVDDRTGRLIHTGYVDCIQRVVASSDGARAR